jgi:hypothetical protein
MKGKGEAPQQQKKTLAQDSVERLVVDQERFQRKDSILKERESPRQKQSIIKHSQQ